LHGIILKPDGSASHEHHLEGTISDAREMGLELGKIVKDEAGESFFEGWA